MEPRQRHHVPSSFHSDLLRQEISPPAILNKSTDSTLYQAFDVPQPALVFSTNAIPNVDYSRVPNNSLNRIITQLYVVAIRSETTFPGYPNLVHWYKLRESVRSTLVTMPSGDWSVFSAMGRTPRQSNSMLSFQFPPLRIPMVNSSDLRMCSSLRFIVTLTVTIHLQS